MRSIGRIEEAEDFTAAAGMNLLYLGRAGCGVCGAIKPKLKRLLAEFPAAEAAEIDLDDLAEAAGRFSVFTVPAILVYVDGRESIREARYLSMDLLAAGLERLYRLRFTE